MLTVRASWLLPITVLACFGATVSAAQDDGVPARVARADARSGQPPAPPTSVARAYKEMRGAVLGSAPTHAVTAPQLGLPNHKDRDAFGALWLELPGPMLRNHAAALDSRRDRIIAIGGDHYPDYLNQLRTWVLDLKGKPAWTELVTTGLSPMPRVGSAAIYDPVRDRLLVFGGWSASSPALNDVWALQLSGRSTWSQLAIAGDAPSPRAFTSAIYDEVHDAMIVFGGIDYRPGVHATYGDTWKLSLSGVPTWRKLDLAPGEPPGRAGCTPVYDPVRHQMIVFGGSDFTQQFGDLWTLSLGDSPAWTQLQSVGPWPEARAAYSFVFDPVSDRFILFDGASAGQVKDLWALRLAGGPKWAKLTPVTASPPWHAGQTAFYDRTLRRMIVFGGISGSGIWEGGTDTWALTLQGSPAWSPLIGGGPLPGPRYDQSAVYDPVRRRMVIFGGYAGGDLAQLLGDMWELPLDGTHGWADVWDRVVGGLDLRAGHGAIYDTNRDRMIVFGGLVDDEADRFFANDLWTASFSLSPIGGSPWTRLDPVGQPPPPRAWDRSIYDPDGDRMILYGGYDGSILGDLWSLSLSGVPMWSEMHPAGVGPGPLSAYSVVYDSREHRMLLFGGSDGHRCHAETWALSLGENPAWTLLIGDMDPRLARSFHSAVYDERERRMVIWGGYSCAIGGDVSDTWELSLKDPPQWRELESGNAPPDPREGHTAVYDPEGDRMVIFAGNATLNDTWALPLPRTKPWLVEQEVQAAASTPAAGPALSAPHPNPFADEAEVEFTLPIAASAAVGIYDATGRAVRRLAEGAYARGAHRVRWDGRDASGRRVAAGLYFVRLETPGTTTVRKVVLARAAETH